MSAKTIHNVGIIMNGVTGRMGLNQHLRRSIHAIIAAGRRATQRQRDASCRSRCWWAAMPPSWKPSRRSAAACPGPPIWTRRSADPEYSIYFDAQTTDRRADAVTQGDRRRQAHLLREADRRRSRRRRSSSISCAEKAGVKHGVVQDKLWLPGMLKLKTLRDLGFFGRIFRVRGEFGYWVFEGDTVPAQRPSWNYRKEDGGGIIIDMLCHWRYVLDNLFGTGQGRLLPGRHAHSRRAGTKPASRTHAPPTTPPTPRSSWKAASSRISILPGACACAATIC